MDKLMREVELILLGVVSAFCLFVVMVAIGAVIQLMVYLWGEFGPMYVVLAGTSIFLLRMLGDFVHDQMGRPNIFL